MKTFEKVLEIFQDYLSCDLEEEVLPCRNGYLRVTWNGDSRYCVDGLLSRTPDELRGDEANQRPPGSHGRR